jgi:hypothetical protein
VPNDDLTTMLQGSAYLATQLEASYQALPECAMRFLSFLSTASAALTSPDFATRSGATGQEPEFNTLRTAIARWMLKPRTMDQLRQCADAPCTCVDPDGLHELGQPVFAASKYKTSFPLVLERFIEIYAESLKQAASPTAINIRFDRAAKRMTWPISLEEMLPYGPEQSIRGLLQWIELDLGPMIAVDMLHALTTVIRLLGSLVLPYVITAAPILITYGIVPIFEYAAILSQDNSGRSLRGTPVQKVAAVTRSEGARILSGIMDRCNDTQRREMTRGHALRLMVVCNQAYAYITRPVTRREEHTRSNLAHIVATLNQDFPSLKHDAAIPPDLRALLAKHSKPGLWLLMLDGINTLMLDGQCVSPDCSRTYSNWWPFKWCGGCRRVKFCSRRCQKAAWNHPVVPHRQTCLRLRSACLKYDIPGPPESAHQFEPTALEERLACDILELIRSHAQYRIDKMRALWLHPAIRYQC